MPGTLLARACVTQTRLKNFETTGRPAAQTINWALDREGRALPHIKSQHMTAIALSVALVLGCAVSAQAASANGTRVPRDAATLTDSLGHVWRLAANAACPTGYKEILRDNGRPVTAYASCGAVILYFNGAVSVQGDDNQWYGWLESGRTWMFLGAAAPDGNAPPPSPTPTPPPLNLPAPWVDADIGSPARAGSASYSSGQFTINASGNDIWNNSDQFHYVYQPLTGDGQIQARVMALSATDAWAKAAVMIRASLAANSAHAMMIATPGNGVSLQYRTTTGAASNYTQGPQQAIPVWVRLVRVGSTFTGSFSINGTTWTTVASQTITMPTNVFVGFAVTSHNVGATTTAIISDVTIGAPSPHAAAYATASDANADAVTQAVVHAVCRRLNERHVVQRGHLHGGSESEHCNARQDSECRQADNHQWRNGG